MRQIGGTKAQFHSFLIPMALDAVNGQLHTLTVLPPETESLAPTAYGAT